MAEPTLAPGERREAVAGPPLVCRLRHKETIGRRGPIPNMGELELENRSAVPVEIAYQASPLEYLDLIVTGPSGAVVSTDYFGNRFSPMMERAVLRLLPGQTFRAPVPLLSTVPPEKRCPGVYTVEAVYEYNRLRVAAAPLRVEVGT